MSQQKFFVHFDSKYVPCGFLIVREGCDPYSDDVADSIVIQSDWDYAGVASTMGWNPCDCGRTDGTVDCKKCKRTVSDMLGEAYDWIRDREGELFEDPGYLANKVI